MVAVAAGAAHSWIVPVKTGLKPRPIAANPQPPVTPDNPVNPSADPNPPPIAPKDPRAVEVPANIDPDTLGQHISLGEARALFEAGVFFIDTRLRHEYDKAHILGAEHLSTVEFGTPKAGEVLAFLSADTHYVLYCEGGECDASENVAIRLQDAFPLFHIMTASFDDWKAAGFDIDSAAADPSAEERP